MGRNIYCKNDDDIIVTDGLAKSIEFEWTDITIELLPNEYKMNYLFQDTCW